MWLRCRTVVYWSWSRLKPTLVAMSSLTSMSRTSADAASDSFSGVEYLQMVEGTDAHL